MMRPILFLLKSTFPSISESRNVAPSRERMRMSGSKPLIERGVSPSLVGLMLCLCGLLTATTATAQGPGARPRPGPDRAASATTAVPAASPLPSAAEIDAADLAITADVTARELLFEVVPNPTVEFTGRPERETKWEAERRNLPRPVQPGVTYRDFGIRLVITSRFADIERIVAEALGEVPVSDAAAPQQPTNTTPSVTTPIVVSPPEATVSATEKLSPPSSLSPPPSATSPSVMAASPSPRRHQARPRRGGNGRRRS